MDFHATFSSINMTRLMGKEAPLRELGF